VSELISSGAHVKAYDPKASENFRMEYPEVEYCMSIDTALEGSDACLILTEWDDVTKISDKDLSKMKGNVIIEGRRALNPSDVKNFEGVCW